MGGMAKLSFAEREAVEDVLGMSGGYVLDLSNAAFRALVRDTIATDPYDDTYAGKGESKANRLRCLLESLADPTAGKILRELIERERRKPDLARRPRIGEADRNRAVAAVERLESSRCHVSLPELTVANATATFELVRGEVERYLDEGKCDLGVDRLHTFLTYYLRLLVAERAELPADTAPLHSLMGTFVRLAQAEGRITSEMTVRILKMSTSTLDAFNTVRNIESLAHPNASIITRPEADFIFTHVIGVVRLIGSF